MAADFRQLTFSDGDWMMTATESLLMVVDNDRSVYEAILAIARDNPDRIDAGDFIKDVIETLCDDAGAGLKEPASLIVAQLFQHALDDVEWAEIADHYYVKIKEGC